jgi:Asp-tRNA(Asn)/Glu-tRNA(Gln) amidotransferase A subunit family amidase
MVVRWGQQPANRASRSECAKQTCACLLVHPTVSAPTHRAGGITLNQLQLLAAEQSMLPRGKPQGVTSFPAMLPLSPGASSSGQAVSVAVTERALK